MLKVQEFLKDNHTFEDLIQFGIEVKKHPVHDIYILDYGQIDSKPGVDISDECRSLVLDSEFNIVSGCMKRFFNLGQVPEYEKHFKWDKLIGWEKRDGSMISITMYKGELLIRTRFSWADSEVGLSGKTWKELVIECLTEKQIEAIKEFDNNTFVFELETPHNQVVLYHEKPQLVLLTIIRNQWNGEWDQDDVDILGQKCYGFKRPTKYEFKDLAEAQAVLDQWNTEGKKDEGFVLYDGVRRLKIKNDRYRYYHSIVTGIQSIRQVFDIVWDEKVDLDELVIEYPHLAPKLKEVDSKILDAWARLFCVWWETQDITERKKFAFAITRQDSKFYTPFSCVLFRFRDSDYSEESQLHQIWRQNKDFIFKVLFKGQ